MVIIQYLETKLFNKTSVKMSLCHIFHQDNYKPFLVIVSLVLIKIWQRVQLRLDRVILKGVWRTTEVGDVNNVSTVQLNQLKMSLTVKTAIAPIAMFSVIFSAAQCLQHLREALRAAGHKILMRHWSYLTEELDSSSIQLTLLTKHSLMQKADTRRPISILLK